MNKENIANSISSVNDYDLVRAFKEGNSLAFEKIVVKYQDRIFNLCYRFLGDLQDAEDTAQEVFIKVFKALKRFRSESSFYTWIYRIAVNTCKNRIKSLDYRRTKKNVELADETDRKINRVITSVNTGNNPDELIEKKERMKQIQIVINNLPSDQKAVIILRDIEGLSYDEISTVTGRKLGTVKSKLSRARNDLRKKLKGII